MVDIVLRTQKGNPLTYVELDNNFIQLKDAVEDLQDAVGQGISLSPIDDNALTYNGGKLYVSSRYLAEYAGVATFDSIIQPETYATPVYDFGDKLRVGNAVFTKIYRQDDMTQFAYILDRRLKLNATNVDLSNVNNGSTAEKLIGSIKVPGDSLRLSKRAKVSITINGSSALSNFEFSVALSPLVRIFRRIKKTVVTGNTTSSVTMEFYIDVINSSIVRFSDDGSALAPTTYPSSTMRYDMANTLANVEIPIYVKWNASVSVPTVNVASVNAYIELVPIDKFLKQPDTVYRDSAKFPYESDDFINKPLTDKIVVKYPVSIYNYSTTGNSTTGTINAQGTLGSDLITLYSVTGLKVGMYPVMTTHTPSYNGDPTPTATIDTAKSFNTLGQGNRIIEILPGTNQIRLKFPLAASFTQRGRDASNNIFGMSFYEDAITLMARFMQTAVATRKGYVTNLTRSTTDLKAVAYPDKISIFRASQDDPVRLWKSNNVVAYNSWLWSFTSGQVQNFYETFKPEFYLKTPVAFTDAAASVNYDRNTILITEDGRYSLESIGTNVGSTAITTSRSTVTDLNDFAYFDILDMDDVVDSGVSFGTRADGFGILRGIIRKHEMDVVPVTANITSETEAEIDARLDIVMNAIQHAIPMVPASAQLKAYQYSAAQTPEVALTYKAFKSQHVMDTPAIASGGTDYQVGDALEIVGGTYVQPMVVTVTSVDALGGVLSVFVSNTGQYETGPTGANNLATINISGTTGSGCFINCINGTTITSDATAFPSMNQRTVRTHPATVVDSGWSVKYNGTIPMGAWFTIFPQLTVQQMRDNFKQRRLVNPNDFGSAYEIMAIQAAIKKYGIFVCDTAGETHVVMFGESAIPGVQWTKATGNNNGDHRNCNAIKASLYYIQNITRNKVVGGTPLASDLPDLAPLNG